MSKTEQAITTKETATAGDKKAEILKQTITTFMLGHNLNIKLSQAQIDLCIQTALSFGLNPLKREIHFVPREIKKKNPKTGYWEGTGKYDVNIIVGYEVYLKRAEETEKLKGWRVTFDAAKTFDNRPDIKAVITIKKDGWDEPFIHEAYLSEAKPDGKAPLWEKQPKFQLRKVAISQGFRLAFPDELGGMPYTPEELGIGVIEGGNLVEDHKPAETAPTPLINAQKAKFIEDLFAIKGKKQDIALSHLKVKKIAELTTKDADALIKKLNSFPDADKVIDVEEDSTQQIDVDQVAKDIDETHTQEAA